jgi:hypothetical protein
VQRSSTTFVTNDQGSASSAAAPGTSIPEDIFYVADTSNTNSAGYVVGFSIP